MAAAEPRSAARRRMVPKANNNFQDSSRRSAARSASASHTHADPKHVYENGLELGPNDDITVETSFTEPLISRYDDDSDGEVRVIGPSTPDHPLEADEAWWQIAIQVFIPYMIAGFGMVAAGLVLDAVQVRKLSADLMFQ